MERILTELAPDPAAFGSHIGLVRSYLRGEPGSLAALLAAANAEPEGLTASIVTLGEVLLDLAAAAYRLTPEEMLDKLQQQVEEVMAS